MGLKDFAIVHDGEEVTKYSNPKHLKRHENNLARKQQKLARKTKGSKTRGKFRKLVAKVYEKVSNTRQDFLHKLSRNIVDESQVIVVENLNVKGMVRNRKLSKAISDVGWLRSCTWRLKPHLHKQNLPPQVAKPLIFS